MKASEAMIAWTPASYGHSSAAGQMEVGLWPDTGRWSHRYVFSAGACMRDSRALKGDAAIAQMMLDFHTAVVRDGIPVDVAHREFLKIDEYRRVISPDIPGAEQDDDT